MRRSESKDVFYVRIVDSQRMRRAILQASKEIIVVLQRYEMFRRLREAKLKMMEELSKQFKEINEITSKMKIDMPKVNFSTSKPVHVVRQAQEKEVSSPEKESISLSKDDDELKKLEESIVEIEKKLQQIQ